MKYACLVYHDPSKVADPSEAEADWRRSSRREATGAWKAELEKVDYPVYSAGLQASALGHDRAEMQR